MISLTADESNSRFLNQARELAAIHDSSGNLLGFFVPSDINTARILAEAHHTTDVVRMRLGKYVTEDVRTLRQILEELKAQTNDQAETDHLQLIIDQKFHEDDAFLNP